MFDVNKWGFKWKDMIPFTYFNQKDVKKKSGKKIDNDGTEKKCLDIGNLYPKLLWIQDLLTFYGSKKPNECFGIFFVESGNRVSLHFYYCLDFEFFWVFSIAKTINI